MRSSSISRMRQKGQPSFGSKISLTGMEQISSRIGVLPFVMWVETDRIHLFYTIAVEKTTAFAENRMRGFFARRKERKRAFFRFDALRELNENNLNSTRYGRNRERYTSLFYRILQTVNKL